LFAHDSNFLFVEPHDLQSLSPIRKKKGIATWMVEAVPFIFIFFFRYILVLSTVLFGAHSDQQNFAAIPVGERQRSFKG
jgi:hypothetical protein